MKKTLKWLFLFTFVLILAACNQASEEEAAPEAEEPKESAPETISVEGVLGPVELEKPAEKVVVLEWTYAEDLLALGVQPVGVADIEGYNTMVQIDEALSSDAVDVGTRQEPNLEAIGQLKPDLIIAPKFRH